MNPCRLGTQHVHVVGTLHESNGAKVASFAAWHLLQVERELMPDRTGKLNAFELQHNVVQAKRATLVFAAGDPPLDAVLDERHAQRRILELAHRTAR